MSDRLSVTIAVPVDDALPPDVQGVGLRRKAIELMQQIATVEESTVRFKGASVDATVYFDDDFHLSLWQMNLLAARFIADGKAKEGTYGVVSIKDEPARIYSAVSVVRNEFD